MWTNTGKRRPAFATAPADGQESVWDYPRPPAILPDAREVVVRYRDVEVARTTRALRVCETASPPTFYLPATDVSAHYLRPAEEHSFCEWKGLATYWSLEIPGRLPQNNVGWSYEQPLREFSTLRCYLSFYPAKVDCYVAGHAVRPQPGGFYGGWITPDIVGPFKGEPGTSGW